MDHRSAHVVYLTWYVFSCSDRLVILPFSPAFILPWIVEDDSSLIESLHTLKCYLVFILDSLLYLHGPGSHG